MDGKIKMHVKRITDSVS